MTASIRSGEGVRAGGREGWAGSSWRPAGSGRGPQCHCGGGGSPLRSVRSGSNRSAFHPLNYRENGAAMQAFEATNYYFNEAAKCLDLTENIRTLMVTPDREVRVEVAIELDSGKIGNFIGYRV